MPPPAQDRRHKRSTSATISDSASPASGSSEEIVKAGWQSLFFYITKADLPLLALAIGVSAIAGAINPGQAFIIGKVFDGFTSYAAGYLDASQLMKIQSRWILYLIGIAGGSWIFYSLEFGLWLAFGELQAKNARDRLFHSLLEKDIEWYDMRQNGIGALLPRLQAQIQDLQLATAQPLGSLFSLTSTVILSTAQAFYCSWKLTLVTLATAPLIVALIILLGNIMRNAFTKYQDKLNEAQKFSTSALFAIETVKCFNGQEIEVRKYISKIDDAAFWNIRVMNAGGLQMGLSVLLAVSMFVQGFYYGGVLVAQNSRTPAEVVTCFMAALGGFQAIQATIPQMTFLEKGRSASATLRAIMVHAQHESVLKRRSSLLKPRICGGEINVQNVTFSYPKRPDQSALDNVTIFIPAGETTYLIGKSGSGKSTLGQLLMGFYSSSQGNIAIDGIPLQSLDTEWLRSNITLVEQTSVLFNDTLFRNIAFGGKRHEQVAKREVTQAAEFALLQNEIYDMPDGLDTVISFRGGCVSGGQRQRIALARSRLRDTPILILDEATSALDHIRRSLMMDAIRHWRRGKTTIIITHDTAQILPDDYLYILECGKIVREGYRKHLEAVKDSSFQRFLPRNLSSTVTPYDTWRGDACQSILTRGSPTDSVSRCPDEGRRALDPFNATIKAGERKPGPLFPNVYGNIGSAPATKPFDLDELCSTTTSQDLQMTVSWLPGYSTDPKRMFPNFDPNHWSCGSNRRSQTLQTLIDRTGKIAADTRTHTVRLKRQRPKIVDAEFAVGRKTSIRERVFDRHTHQPDAQQGYYRIMCKIWPSLDWTSRFRLILAFWGGAIHAAGTPAFSYVLSKLLATYAIPGGDKTRALIYSIAMLSIAITDAMHSWIWLSMFGIVSQSWVDSTRTKAFGRILDQPKSFFDQNENSVSRITLNLDRNADNMGALLGRFTPLVFTAASMCSIAVAWSLVTQWRMTLIAVVVAPYILGVTKAFAAVSAKWEVLSNDAAESASSIFTETFTNIKTVRVLTLEKHFTKKYVTATNRALAIGFQRSVHAGFFYGISHSSRIFSTAIVLYVGTKLVATGTPVDKVVQVFVMLIFAITNVTDMLSLIPQIANSKDTATRLLRFAELSKDTHEHRGNTQVFTIGDIVFDNLRFAYPSRPAQTILKNLTLRILPGTSTAIVGGSGSGKSTIASLLLSIYSTSEVEHLIEGDVGALTIAGRGLQHIHTPSIRSLIVPVSQTPTLFATTVADNITYGLSSDSPYCDKDHIEQAARRAGIHDFINDLPLGYNTPIGDGGLGLSGGQSQRIAIARALVRNPKVLVLDEATSALDVVSAGLVRDTIQELVRSKSNSMTVIIITHSREMMEIAERIVVLDQGHIVEEGGFDELLAKGGALATLLRGGEVDGELQGHPLTSSGNREVPKLTDVDWTKQKKTREQGWRRAQ